ncbi:unnamed protein product [Cylindrotheca closterium]|uniref:ER membrane protein complex subunit 6 n=1 Tax=Cylindrotheca closterium TaxID=2856 RepID=A0AAD2CP92_9STRA|nr:unnamed protein product [Cylindrotheca closterium]
MIDPMANLDAGVPGSSQSDEEKDIIDFMSLRYNLEKIDRMKSVMSIASGCLAGICGLTGLQGLVCFVALHFLVLVVVWTMKMKCSLHGYTRQSWWSYSTTNLQQSGLSFTLFWTLFYGLVYLY